MARRTLLVLAGGFGTRLRAAVADVPKPLAPVAQRPYLHYLLENWRKQGVDKLVFLLHHQADLIKEFLKAQRELLQGVEVDISVEPQPLGTGGAVAFAVRQRGLKESFLVTNADTWLGSGLNEICDAEAPAMAIVRAANVERYGSVRLEQHRIVAFAEKEKSVGAGWVNAGLYRIDAGEFEYWDGQPFSLEKDFFPELAASGRLQGVPLHTDFIDIGIPEDYARFCRWVASGKTDAL